MRLAVVLLLVVVAAAGLVFGAWWIYPPAGVLVGAGLSGLLGYGLLTGEERARL